MKGASPGLDDGQVLEALRYMMIGRAMDERCWSMQRQGKLGTFAPIIGQEAAIMGSSMALGSGARLAGAPVSRAAGPASSWSSRVSELSFIGKAIPPGGELPAGVKVMPYQVSLAAQLPHAVGLAWGMRLQEQPGVAIVYFRRRCVLGRRLPRVLQSGRCGVGAGDFLFAEQSMGHLDPTLQSVRHRRPRVARAGVRVSRGSRWTATTCWRCTR